MQLTLRIPIVQVVIFDRTHFKAHLTGFLYPDENLSHLLDHLPSVKLTALLWFACARGPQNFTLTWQFAFSANS